MPDETEREKKPGPDPERLKIAGDWKKAVKKAMPKEKPPEGWPRGVEESRADSESDER